MALRAGAHSRLGCGEDLLGLLPLLHLAITVDKAAEESQEDSRDATKRDLSIEKDDAADGERELVQITDERVRSRRSLANAPGRRVRDEDGTQARIEHANHEVVARLGREVLSQVGRRPVLGDQGADDHDREGEQVVIEHGWSLPVSLSCNAW